MPRKMPKVLLILTALAAALAGLCAFCPISNSLILRPLLANFNSQYVSGHISPMPFDRDLWRAGKARHRVAMAHDLADKNLLDGKTRTDLVGMLGEPDIDKPEDEGTRWLLGYHAKGLFDETLWLAVTMGEDGTASGAVVFADWHDPRRQ